jgi:HAD superfamily hydrolase (TIGR01509 family)
MDGVIVDSTAAHTEAWRRYLRAHGIEVSEIDKRMLGKHNSEIVRDFFSNMALTDEDVFAHGARKEALYREIIRPYFHQRVVPGIVEFIRRHQGLPMAVASNAEPANLEFVLDLAGLRDCFSIMVTAHDVERPKPDPQIYLKTATLLGVRPLDCLVFEDSETGVVAARAAGMKVVGILTTLPEFDNVDLAIRNFLDPALDRWIQSFVSGDVG